MRKATLERMPGVPHFKNSKDVNRPRVPQFRHKEGPMVWVEPPDDGSLRGASDGAGRGHDWRYDN